MIKRKLYIWFGLIVASCLGMLLIGGCSKINPVAAPPSTVIVGTARVTISGANGWRADYTFRSSGYVYGKISIVSLDQQNCLFEANGIQVGSGTTAPIDGYSRTAQVVLGQSYFIKTDAVPHYGRVTVIGLNQSSKYSSITVTFDWVVQTEAGNRNLQ